MEQIINRIGDTGIVPVVVLEHEKDAMKLGEALCENGLMCAEITFRTKEAAQALRRMKKEFPQMLIGAGTVLTKEQLNTALDAGAEFIVSPGFDEEIVDACIDEHILILPGCVTPTEIGKAVKKGLKVVKFFPSNQFGGLSTMKALAAPYPQIRFMPTGGITTNNLKEYLTWDKIIACGGSWMVQKEMIEAGDYTTIGALAKEAVKFIAEVRGKKI